MKSIYVIRHGAREFGAVHLNAEGVRTARALGEQLGPMAFVATSPAQRCIETAVALGCAIQAEADELALPEDDDLMLELDRVRDFADAGHLLSRGKFIPGYAQDLRRYIERVAGALHDHQDALLVTHGGIIEVIAAEISGAAVAANLGDGVGYCDGVRIVMESKSKEDEKASAVPGQWTVQKLCS